MTTMVSNLRSTAVLTEYVRTCDALARYAILSEVLQMKEKQLRPAVLEEIGERRAVTVRGTVRILTPGESSSVKRVCTDEEIVEFCKSAGLKYSERSAEYCAPASFSKYVREGLIPSELFETTVERRVSIV